jgi:hypothetical protein
MERFADDAVSCRSNPPAVGKSQRHAVIPVRKDVVSERLAPDAKDRTVASDAVTRILGPWSVLDIWHKQYVIT